MMTIKQAILPITATLDKVLEMVDRLGNQNTDRVDIQRTVGLQTQRAVENYNSEIRSELREIQDNLDRILEALRQEEKGKVQHG